MAGEVFVIVNANARRFVEADTGSLLADLHRLVEGRSTLRVTRSRAELHAAARDASAR